MEPSFCRLLALCHKVNFSWLCVCIKSEHPAADMLETSLRKTTSGQRSGCFSQLPGGIAENLVVWSLSLHAPQGSPTLTQSLLSKTCLLCGRFTSGAAADQRSTRTRGTAKQCFHVVCWLWMCKICLWYKHTPRASQPADQGSASQ